MKDLSSFSSFICFEFKNMLRLTHCGLVAYAALHHMLVHLALHRYGTLTDPTVDDWSAAAVWAALR